MANKTLAYRLRSLSDADLAAFGSQLAAARKAKGLTQRQVADRLLVSHITVSRWENGKLRHVGVPIPPSKASWSTVSQLLSLSSKIEKVLDFNVRRTLGELLADAKQQEPKTETAEGNPVAADALWDGVTEGSPIKRPFADALMPLPPTPEQATADQELLNGAVRSDLVDGYRKSVAFVQSLYGHGVGQNEIDAVLHRLDGAFCQALRP